MGNWMEASVETVFAAAEAVSHFLESLGCAGVLLESGPHSEEVGGSSSESSIAAWVEVPSDPWRTPVVIKGYLPLPDGHGGTAVEEDRRARRLAEHLRRIPAWGLAPAPPRLALRVVSDEDWADAWKAHYHPIPVGERLVIHPTWEEPDEGLKDRIAVRLDPGMAFGTGAHPTTVLCLEALERLIRPGMRLLDAGTGSGILSVAAAKLGAREVVAVDQDPLAVRVARQNVRQNGVADRVRALHVAAEEVDGRYDCIVANLVADLLIGLADWIPRHLAPRGVFLGCGIVDRRETDVADAWARIGLTRRRTDRLGEWRSMEVSL